MITDLPPDILILICETLRPAALASLAQTCRTLYIIVNNFGWSSYLSSNSRPSFSLSSARACWPASFRVKYDTLSDDAWNSNRFVARPLSNPWPGKHSPHLAVSTSRLVVAAGSNIYSYKFGTPISDDDHSAPSVITEASFSLAESHRRPGDITGITLGRSDEPDDTFFIAFQDGIIERVKLTSATSACAPSIVRHTVDTLPTGDFSDSLSSSSNLLLSLSSNGLASIANYNDTSSFPSSTLNWSSTIDLKARGWASHLCMSSSTPYAAFGTSQSRTPLSVYYLFEGQFASSEPSVLLSTGSDSKSSSSAVYGLSQAPPSSPWGASPQILVAGWYNGKVCCYDLRTPSYSAISSNGGFMGTLGKEPTLQPVLSLSNPWSYDPIYSVSCGGGSGSHIAAGSGNHGILSFWDVRAPKDGWSVYAPGNDRSPVYSVILESSRCFGATENRPFVYDFGPGVTVNTYPPISRTRGDRLKNTGKINYYVTKYLHSRGIIHNEH